jgi:hypothetical protein
MSAYTFCSQVVRIPAADHYGWRGSLVAFQGVCLVAYAAAAWLNRGRLFVASQKRVWDLDTAYMGLSIAAAAAGIATWGSWLDLAARKVQTQSAVASGDHLRIAEARFPECVVNAAYLFAKPVSVVMYSSSQLLVALRLLDMVNIGRGPRARQMKRRLRIVTLVACALLNAPSFAGCWIAAAVYDHPLYSPLISFRHPVVAGSLKEPGWPRSRQRTSPRQPTSPRPSAQPTRGCRLQSRCSWLLKQRCTSSAARHWLWLAFSLSSA